MKKILYSSIVLTIFSLSVILFQISCQDEAEAGNTATTPANRFLYILGGEINETGVSTSEFWTANLDGTDKKKIPIVLPEGLEVGDGGRLTPDGQTLIFSVEAENEVDDIDFIYSVSIDGSNLKMLVDAAPVLPGTDSYYEVLQTY